jgi:hypothetical protein
MEVWYILKWFNWTPVVHTCNPSYSGGRNQNAEIRRIAVRNQPRQIVWETPSQKIPNHKMAGWLAQVLETCLANVRPWVQIPQKDLTYFQGNKYIKFIMCIFCLYLWSLVHNLVSCFWMGNFIFVYLYQFSILLFTNV